MTEIKAIGVLKKKERSVSYISNVPMFCNVCVWTSSLFELGFTNDIHAYLTWRKKKHYVKYIHFLK
jgi:hypothetical protein